MYPHKYELLQAPAYKWKRVAAVKFRPNGKVNETQFARISEPIGTALKQSRIRSVGILPPTWRNPSYCALGIIHSLWTIGYAAEVLPKTALRDTAGKLVYNAANTQFKIISDTGTEYFEEGAFCITPRKGIFQIETTETLYRISLAAVCSGFT